MRGAGPSGGMLKKMFDPKNVKKKEKSALGMAPAGGHKISDRAGMFGKKGNR